MHLAAVRGIHQEAHVNEFVVEALWRLLVDEANVSFDLDFDSVMGFDHLNSHYNRYFQKHCRLTVER